MKELNNEMTDTVKSIAGGILGGQMSPNPIENGNELHCEKCAMKTVCRSSHKFKK
jgi:ATP-dependent helicase/DNAse subunit B